MNQMLTELTLQILDAKGKRLAITTIIFGEEPLKPIPAVGDSITLATSEANYQGIVFARAFDYSVVDEIEPLRISIDARLVANGLDGLDED